MNIIPKPLKAAELGGKVFFSSKTEVKGDFAETINFAVKVLSEKATAAENVLSFDKDDSISDEGYKISCEKVTLP